jgi:hypothetical protein
VSVVDAVPVESVIQASADCSDRARAEAALAAALSKARAPRRATSAAPRAWQVELRVSTVAPGMKVADARIIDDIGTPVAERSVSDKTAGSCVALAQAVSAWAQIVLDDELARAHDEAQRRDDLEQQKRDVLPETQPIHVVDGSKSPAGAPPRPEEDGPTASETDPEKRTYEIGTMLILRNGVASTGGIFGASPYVTVAFSQTWVLRPSLLLGTSTSRVPPDQSRSANLTFLGGRFDFCRRMPGNYIDHRGIEVDACAGGDMAYVGSELQQALRASLGPSAVVRGELGQKVGLEIRGMLGANLLRGGFGPDAPFFVASAELGGSVRFR